MYETLQCVAEHGKSVPSKLRNIIKKSARSDNALRALTSVIRQDKVLKSLVGTTQAIDLIQGGVKSNALPEQAWAIVNHRIAVVRCVILRIYSDLRLIKHLANSSLDEVKEHDTNLLKSLGGKFNLTYSAFGSLISEEGAPASGSLTLSDAFHGGLEPAPITPTGKDASPYQLLSGTIKATYNVHRSLSGLDDSIIVAPSMMSGNTGTYLSSSISRIFAYAQLAQIHDFIGSCLLISSVITTTAPER